MAWLPCASPHWPAMTRTVKFPFVSVTPAPIRPVDDCTDCRNPGIPMLLLAASTYFPEILLVQALRFKLVVRVAPLPRYKLVAAVTLPTKLLFTAPSMYLPGGTGRV